MEKINIAELLKDCPSGMELDCTMYDSAQLNYVLDGHIYPIKIQTPEGIISLTKDGCYSHNKLSKCIIFPKGKTTWEGFVPPCGFKDGDIVFYNDTIAIFKEWDDETLFRTYVTKYLCCDLLIDTNVPLFGKGIRKETRFATEAEKAKLFKAIEDNGYKWNAETKTLEKLSPNFREHSDNEPLDIPTMTTEFVKEHGLPCPNGYVFKDDNGNMINTTKIVLEKIKKEYPKTYEECAKVLLDRASVRNDFGYKGELLVTLQKLLVCRNAYWKIAGEEMGLDGPWEPDWKDFEQLKYCIWVDVGDIILNEGCRCQHILTFPTKEMRDAFYENFKNEIEQCKELL